MLTTEKINSLIGVVESYQSSYELKKIMTDPTKRIGLFREFLKEETDLSFDWFTDYFQEEHSEKWMCGLFKKYATPRPIQIKTSIE